MEKKNLSAFRDYVKTKYRFAQMYANQLSKFGENNFRKKVFSIKSNLANDALADEQLYIPINLARAVTRTFTNYVIGKGFSVDFGDEGSNKDFVAIADDLKLQTLLNEVVDNQSSIGYSIVRVRTKDNKPRVEIIPVDNYLANMESLMIGDGFEDIKEHFVFSVIKQNDKKVFYVDRYEKVEWSWEWYYGEIWERNENFVLTKILQEAKTKETMDTLPLFLVNNDLKNTHTASEDFSKDKLGNIPRYFAQSDYVDIADILQELNDRGSQISIEFVKNLTSKMSLPSSFKASEKAQGLRKVIDETLPKKQNPDYILHGHGEQPAQYITKDGSYLSISIQHLWTSVEIGARFLFPSGKSAGEKSLGYLSSIIRSIAIGLDQIGNSVCRDMLNRLLITSGWYSFGRIQETISSVLGKNEKSWTLTRLGRAIVAVLDWLDKDHCEKCIQDFIS